MPGFWKVKEKVWPAFSIPESQSPLSLVTVWGCFPLLVQVTVAPGDTVRDADEKKSSPRETPAPPDCGAGAGGAAGGWVGAGEAAGGAAGGFAGLGASGVVGDEPLGVGAGVVVAAGGAAAGGAPLPVTIIVPTMLPWKLQL